MVVSVCLVLYLRIHQNSYFTDMEVCLAYDAEDWAVQDGGSASGR